MSDKVKQTSRLEPRLIHTYIHLNDSLIHAVEYCLPDAESILCNPTSDTELTKHNNVIDDRELIVFVPGNPGVLGMYHEFLCELFKFSIPGSNKRSKNPVILALSHNNFDHPNSQHHNSATKKASIIKVCDSDLNFLEKSISSSYKNDCNHIEMQITNKLFILKRLVKLNSFKLSFVAHSIGCYITLRLLQDEKLVSRHFSTTLIHPVIENIAKTERGMRVSRILKYKGDWFFYILSTLINLTLPKVLKKIAIQWIFSSETVKECSDDVYDSLSLIIHPRNVKALVSLAKSEFKCVKNLDADYMIKPHVSKLKLIYAPDDGWININTKAYLSEKFPDLSMEVVPTEHAFVMDKQSVYNIARRISIWMFEMETSKGV